MRSSSSDSLQRATDVFVSDLLRVRHPALLSELRTKLAAFNIALREIAGTRDIWCRDYMPVPSGSARLAQFRYTPSYLADAPELASPPEIGAHIRGTNRQSELVVDGGNVVRRGRIAVVTDRVFTENPSLSRREVERRLRDDLELGVLVIVPVEPGDVLGHADGVLHLIDEHTALVNDYRDVDPAYGAEVVRVLRMHGIAVVSVPYVPDLSSRQRIPPATGVYVNLLDATAVVVVPKYGIAADEAALAAITSAFGNRCVTSIDSRGIARKGGALRCVTWEANIG